MRELAAKVESQGRDIADLTRRFDDLSKAHRLLTDQLEAKTLKLKKGEAA